MAQRSKYADYSDIDDAPEYYQTPDSPPQTAEPDTSSSDSTEDYDDEDEDEDDPVIDKAPTQADQARKHFQLSNVDASRADFSDRLHKKRRSYKTSRRKDRLGDFSDEEDETLERKLARLQREVREVQEEVERQRKEREERGESDEDEDDSEDEEEDSIDPTPRILKISEELDKVYLQRRRGQGQGPRGAEALLSRSARKFAQASNNLQQKTANGTNGTQDQDFLQSPMTPAAAEAQKRHALQRAADFDARLSAMESALGLNALTMPDMAKSPAKPILYTLETLDAQISALADPNSLDPASRKLSSLLAEAEKLDSLRNGNQSPTAAAKTSKQGSSALQNGVSADDFLDGPTLERINDLYKHLPAIDELHPTLPMVVERLRSLRLIHTAAGGAKGLLDDVDRRQSELDKEIAQWRQQLSKIEDALQKGDESLKTNVGGMGGRIRELEQRLEGLGIEG